MIIDLILYALTLILILLIFGLTENTDMIDILSDTPYDCSFSVRIACTKDMMDQKDYQDIIKKHIDLINSLIISKKSISSRLYDLMYQEQVYLMIEELKKCHYDVIIIERR